MKRSRRLIVPAVLSAIAIGGPASIIGCGYHPAETSRDAMLDLGDAARDGRADARQVDARPDAADGAADDAAASDAGLADTVSDSGDAGVDAMPVDAMPVDTPA